MRLLREFVRSPGKMFFAGAGVRQCWSLFKHHLPRAQEQQFPNGGSQAGKAELAWLNRDLLLDTRWKRKACASGSKVRGRGNNTEMLLPTVGRKFLWSKLSWSWSCQSCGGQKKRFFKSINGKRQCENSISPFQHLTNRDRDKAEVFSTSFVSVFNMGHRPRGSQCPELEHRDCDSDQLPVNLKLQDLQLQMNPCKSMGRDGIYPRILKELLLSSQNPS